MQLPLANVILFIEHLAICSKLTSHVASISVNVYVLSVSKDKTKASNFVE